MDPVPDLLAGLAEIVRRHRSDPAGGGLGAMRALRAAGATWADVLPIAHWIGHKGCQTPWPGPGGGTREQMAILLCGRVDTATPMQLAEMAVILAGPRTAGGDARATKICSEHNAVLKAEHKAEIAALLAVMPDA